jgi:hypothetical protein
LKREFFVFHFFQRKMAIDESHQGDAGGFLALGNLGYSSAEWSYPPFMSKKPPLTLVEPDTTLPQPPRKLGEHGMKLWRDVHAEYNIDDIGGIELLAQACTSLDRAEELASHINKDGVTIRTKSGLKSHPSIRDEMSCRAFVVRTLQKLGLNLEQIKSVGRPSSRIGLTWDKLQERE